MQNGGAAPSLVLMPKVADGLVPSTRKKKRKLPVFHKNKLNCPKLVSWQELGVMKESQLFPCPFQWWRSLIPPLGLSPVAVLAMWQSPWYSSASCCCSWEDGREVAGCGGSVGLLWDHWWSEQVFCHFWTCLEILGLEGNELGCCAWLARSRSLLAEGWH